MLEIKNLFVNYGNMEILRNISLNVGQGEIVSLVGGNGSGKTTLCRAVSGLIDVLSGEILYNGERIEEKTPGGMVARKIIQVPEGRMLFERMTVKDNLVMGAFKNKSRHIIDKNLEYVYELFPDLKNKEKAMAGSLSGGQQQMVAIARGLMANPDLLILDEPSIGLSPVMTQQVLGVIKTINNDGVSILIAEQNVAQVLKMADRAYVMEQGKIILEGSAKEILKNELVRKAYLGM